VAEYEIGFRVQRQTRCDILAKKLRAQTEFILIHVFLSTYPSRFYRTACFYVTASVIYDFLCVKFHQAELSILGAADIDHIIESLYVS